MSNARFPSSLLLRPTVRRFALALLTVTACKGTPSQPTWAKPEPPASDPAEALPAADTYDLHTAAHPDEVVTTHIGLSWKVSFADKRVAGHATLAVNRKDAAAPLRLDTRGLDVQRVETAAHVLADNPRLATLDGVSWTEATWRWDQEDAILGRPLVVDLPPGATVVRVHYRTGDGATGLQWLEPAQTASGKPFLYSQSQAIHGRSFIPCQDSPGIRVTYDAVVEVDEPLVVVMAGRRTDTNGAEVAPDAVPTDGRHTFDLRQPIPAYLLAFAVGDLQFQSVGHRTGVWAEPTVVQKAADEFAEMEPMLQTTETLYGPYRWERYDVLVLPPAFPFGGMENPRLTFATPTILAGDRSLVSLIAHEMAHSWSGNLVTNAAWGHMWLNEGFTVYIERRIVEALYGSDRERMEAVLGVQDLQDELEVLATADERLAVSLTGRDPDDGLTDVPYEKGALFLRQLELAYGREVFDPFLRAWFDSHAFTSVVTDEFETFLRAQLVDVAQTRPGAQAVDAGAWIHQPGIPAGATLPTSDAFVVIDGLIEEFAAGSVKPSALPGATWTPHQWLHFLRHLPADLASDKMAALDDTYALTKSGNYEVLAQWLDVAVRRGYAPADARLEEFLMTVGRRKFLVPLYEALIAADRHADAKRIYAKARGGYHAVTSSTLDALVGVP